MTSSKVLVVFFSRTGTTKHVGLEIAKALAADVAELTEGKSRRGLLGYLRSGFEASRGKTTTLRDSYQAAPGYGLVVVGTPVWVASVSSPVRTFLRRHAGQLPRLAFFATMGGRGSETAFSQMAVEAKRSPIASVAFTDREVRSAKHLEKLTGFVSELRKASASTSVTTA